MNALTLSSEEQSIVVFKVWQSLPYQRRMVLAFSLVGGGVFLQCFGVPAIVGWVLVLAGNLLLVVQGYDNRIKDAAYTPDSAWESIGKETLDRLETFEEQVKDWDRSVLDVSNPLGFLAFAGLAGALCLILVNVVGESWAPTFVVDAALLFVPHWFFGMRRISLLVKPAFAIKSEVLQRLAQGLRHTIEGRGCTIDHLVQLTGRKPRAPQDIKLRVRFPEERKDFLGFYVQVVTNNVQGRNYPYVYTVIVAKRGYGLKRIAGRHAAPDKVTHEFETKRDVEYIVVRQTTTKKTGYHTDAAAVRRIFGDGLGIAEDAVR